MAASTDRVPRAALAALVLGLAALTGLGGYAAWRALNPPTMAGTFASLGRGADDVRLTDSTGESVRWGDLKGHPRAVFFGFTRCPEICPTTLNELSAAIDLAGPAASALKVQFVTVDPARDTPQLLSGYVGWFGGAARGYTGDEAQIARLAQSYRVHYRKVPLSAGDYTMDHTALVYLLDRRGRVRDAILFGAGPERAAAQIKALLAQEPS